MFEGEFHGIFAGVSNHFSSCYFRLGVAHKPELAGSNNIREVV